MKKMIIKSSNTITYRLLLGRQQAPLLLRPTLPPYLMFIATQKLWLEFYIYQVLVK